MEAFQKEQAVITIGNVTLGGQPGEYPTCLIGSMFYKSHKVVQDTKKGIFDKERAAQQIRDLEEISRKTGMPFIIDVVGNTSDNLVKYCQFVADTTENDQQPFLMDGLSDEIRVPAIKALMEAGLGNRLIYNSIEPKITDETIAVLGEFKVKNAVLLAFDSRMLLPKQKFKLLEGWDDLSGMKEGLLKKAKRAGVENCIIDVAVLDMPSIGICARTIFEVKENFGLPAGCAPSNAIFDCPSLTDFGKEGRITSLISSCTFLSACGADFILFGPAKYGKDVFLGVAHSDAFNAYVKRRVDKIKPKSESHPLRKIF